MADPLFGFTPRPAASDPLMGFQPTPPPSSAAAPDLGSTAVWNKPADTSWSDFMLAHLAKPFQGVNQAAQDYSRTAVDAATFGLGDRLQSYLTGNPLDQERAATAAASGRLGAMAPIVSGAMYAAGPGELGAASKIGEAVAPAIGKWAGGVLGSGVEGALAGGAGAAGHDEDVGQGALLGGAFGAAGGVPGGVVGRGAALTPPVTEDALRAAAKTAYAPLDAIVFHGPTQVKPALDAVTNTMTDAEQDLAKSTMAKVNKLGGVTNANGTVTGGVGLATASDLQSYQKIFGNLAQTGTDEDREFAPKFKDALEGVMQNTTPIGRNVTPGQGMSLMTPGQLGAPGPAAGEAAAARDAGNIPFGRAEDLKRLQDWQDKSAVAGGPDVGGQASAWLRTPEGQQYAPPPASGAAPSTAPQYSALNNLAQTNAGPDLSAAPNAWDVRHAVHPLVSALTAGAVTGAGGQIAEGHFDPATLAAEMLSGMATGYMLHKGVPTLTKTFIQGPAQARAIDAARSTLSTGQFQAPVLPDANFRDAVRSLIFGQGARGAY
jgi:hypothetical protein